MNHTPNTIAAASNTTTTSRIESTLSIAKSMVVTDNMVNLLPGMIFSGAAAGVAVYPNLGGLVVGGVIGAAAWWMDARQNPSMWKGI